MYKNILPPQVLACLNTPRHSADDAGVMLCAFVRVDAVQEVKME